MKLRTPEHTQEARPAAEAPAVDLAAREAAHARTEAFLPQAQTPLVSKLAEEFSLATGAVGAKNHIPKHPSPTKQGDIPGVHLIRDGVQIALNVAKWELDKTRFSEWQDDPTPVWLVRAKVGDEIIGWAEFYENWWTVENVQVQPEFQRRGVATAIYNAIENHWGLKLGPSDNLESNGRAFWKERDPWALRNR